MNEPTKTECIDFLRKEIDWFNKGGYSSKPYAQKRIRIITKTKELLEAMPNEKTTDK